MKSKYYNLLDSHYKTNLVTNDLKILFFLGKHGIGKTQLVKDYCNRNGLPLKIMNGACMDSTDLTGRAYVEDGETVYAKPDFLNMEEGILFFDEVNRITNSDTKAGLHSLFQDRSVNGHMLSPKVLMVTAGNPIEDKYETDDGWCYLPLTINN
jgi:MoxR-like ATPase